MRSLFNYLWLCNWTMLWLCEQFCNLLLFLLRNCGIVWIMFIVGYTRPIVTCNKPLRNHSLTYLLTQACRYCLVKGQIQCALNGMQRGWAFLFAMECIIIGPRSGCDQRSVLWSMGGNLDQWLNSRFSRFRAMTGTNYPCNLIHLKTEIQTHIGRNNLDSLQLADT